MAAAKDLIDEQLCSFEEKLAEIDVAAAVDPSVIEWAQVFRDTAAMVSVTIVKTEGSEIGGPSVIYTLLQLRDACRGDLGFDETPA